MLILSINIFAMRNTSLVTISLPPAMVKESERLAKNRQMTRSEFMRAAIRKFIEEFDESRAKRIAWEEKDTLKAIQSFERAKKAGKLKVLLPGDLAKWAKE